MAAPSCCSPTTPSSRPRATTCCCTSPNGSIDDLLVLERGEGPYVFDTEGKRYIDALSSLFCAQLGYSYGEEMAAVAGARS